MHPRKTLLAAAVVVFLAAVGAYAYVSRPVAAPSAPIRDASGTEPAGTGDRYVISQAESKVEFNVGEVLRGEPFLVVGTTDQVAGEIVLDANDPGSAEIGPIRINARTLKTDNPQRNGALARFILKSEDPANEFIVFTPKAIAGLPPKIAAGEPFTFTITGDLTVSGVTKETDFTGGGQLVDPTRLVGTAEATVRYKDFGLAIPNVPFVANVQDDVKLKITFVALRS